MKVNKRTVLRSNGLAAINSQKVSLFLILQIYPEIHGAADECPSASLPHIGLKSAFKYNVKMHLIQFSSNGISKNIYWSSFSLGLLCMIA